MATIQILLLWCHSSQWKKRSHPPRCCPHHLHHLSDGPAGGFLITTGLRPPFCLTNQRVRNGEKHSYPMSWGQPKDAINTCGWPITWSRSNLPFMDCMRRRECTLDDAFRVQIAWTYWCDVSWILRIREPHTHSARLGSSYRPQQPSNARNHSQQLLSWHYWCYSD